MNRTYGFILLILALGFAFAAAVWPHLLWRLFWGYTAFAFLMLSLAYLVVGPRFLMKKNNGTRRFVSRLLFWPYFLLNEFTFFLARRGANVEAFARITDRLYLGRRLTNKEAAKLSNNWDAVLDLACEFSEVAVFRREKNYYSLPVLDAAAPTLAELQQALKWLTTELERGPVYVHCALGHGRSATMVIAYLLQTGVFPTWREARAELKKFRNGIKLHPPQRRLLERLEKHISNQRG